MRKFFDRHMGARVALQVLLDASPLLLFAWAAAEITIAGDWATIWTAQEFGAGTVAFLLFAVPLFIIAIFMGLHLPEFEVYPGWGHFSVCLRCFSAAAALIGAYLDLMLICWIYGL